MFVYVGANNVLIAHSLWVKDKIKSQELKMKLSVKIGAKNLIIASVATVFFL